MNKDFTITVITGATSSGKTKLAIDLALKTNAQIICADSRSVYKDLDIVSAKVTTDEMQGVKHHLLDIVSPNEDFSAGDFAFLARKKIDEIKTGGQNVIIAGGTWFYIKSLLEENELPKIKMDKKLREELAQKSEDELWQMLYELDSVRAGQIHKNNKDKVIRSIEMCKALNAPISQHIRPKKEEIISAKWFMPKIEREELYQRINQRVDLMLQMGLYEEWQRNKEKYPNSKVIKNTIGYREFFEFEDFDLAVEKIKQKTRNFAKRQLTYFRSNSDIVEISGVDEMLNTHAVPILHEIADFGKRM